MNTENLCLLDFSLKFKSIGNYISQDNNMALLIRLRRIHTMITF